MPRVLLVTSAYRPTAIADMHRARHLAWELPALGWDVEVLAPGLEFQRPEYTEPGERWLFSPDVPAHSAQPSMAALFRLANMRSIGWRAWWPLFRKGLALLREGRFDLVYITTAHFPLFCLGAAWQRQTGVPYVVDYHDPWVRRDAGERTTSRSMKRHIANMLSGTLESTAVRHASAIVSVSPVYLEELRSRFGNLPQLSAGRTAAIPFAASDHDFPPDGSPVRRPAGSIRTITYIGAGGRIMSRSFRTICESLARIREQTPSRLDTIRIRIAGTDSEWHEGGPRPLQEIAAEFGLEDVVREEPRRVTYSAAMQAVMSSDGLIVLGVDDDGYVPSKLFNYALTGLPLLACLRSDSPAVKHFTDVPSLGRLLTFPTTLAAPSPTNQLQSTLQFLDEVVSDVRFDRRRTLAPHMAPAMARRHVTLFERAIAQ